MGYVGSTPLPKPGYPHFSRRKNHCLPSLAAGILVRRYIQSISFYMGVEPKIGVAKPPKWMVCNGKPYEQIHDLGGFLETPTSTWPIHKQCWGWGGLCWKPHAYSINTCTSEIAWQFHDGFQHLITSANLWKAGQHFGEDVKYITTHSNTTCLHS